MYESFYIYQYIDEEEHNKRKKKEKGEKREKKMKAKIDREQTGEIHIKGIHMEIAGRIKGVNRALKKVIKMGKQNQQDRQSEIGLGAGGVNTKYGTLGVKVQCATERKRAQKEIRIRVVAN